MDQVNNGPFPNFYFSLMHSVPNRLYIVSKFILIYKCNLLESSFFKSSNWNSTTRKRRYQQKWKLGTIKWNSYKSRYRIFPEKFSVTSGRWYINTSPYLFNGSHENVLVRCKTTAWCTGIKSSFSVILLRFYKCCDSFNHS